jgi:CoA:oxalate CoA-transferase
MPENIPHILNGFRVLDMTHVLAGPSATRLMAEMGAEVIKVEFPPLGDIARSLPAIASGRSAYYVQQNRGKLSICLDAKTDEGKEIMEDLIRESDVFIENFAPGVIGRLGFSWERVHEINPNLVMCSVSAFGQSGPLSALPGFDYIAQAYTGIMGMIGDPDGAPAFPMAGLGDVMTGANAASAIGFALLHRERGGGGQYIDVSLIHSYIHCHELNIQLYSVSKGEVEPTRSGHHHFAICPLGLFKGSKNYICIIALEPQWPGICRAMNKPELINDPRYDTNEKRVNASETVIDIVQSWVDSVGSDDLVLEKLGQERVPCAPVLSISEVVENPHMIETGAVRTVNDPKLGEFSIPGMPLRFSDFQHNQPLESAYLGEHNEQVFREVLGYDEQKIALLKKKEVIASNPDT